MRATQDGLNPSKMPEDVAAALGERYSSVVYISSGATASVFSAEDADLGKKVAIKVLRNANERDLIEFQKEAKAAAKLDHENLVSILDFGKTHKNRGYLIMGFVDGLSLETLIRERGPLPLPEAINILIQICDGLKHAHSKGIAHRDLKTSNIMIWNIDGEQQRAVIVDFGLAKENKEPESSRLKTGAVVGSPLYISPEQASGKLGDARSDIYGLACIAYKIISGHTPFEHEELFQLLRMHVEEEPPLLSECVGEDAEDACLLNSLDMCLLKMLHKDPADRYQTIEEVRYELLAILDQIAGKPETATTHDTAPQTRITSWLRARLPWFILAAVSATAILAFLAIVFLTLQQGSAPQAKKKITPLKPITLQSDSLAKPVRKVVKPFEAVFKMDDENDYIEWDEGEHAVPISPQSLSDEDLACLADPDCKLKRLSLAHTQTLEGEGFKYLNRPGLTSLDLTGAKLTQKGFDQIAQLKYLECLSLDCTEVTDAQIELISKLPRLRVLSINHCKNLTDRALEHLGKHAKNLHVLEVAVDENNKAASSAITDRGFAALAGCTALTRLQANQADITDAAIEKLVVLPRLSDIKLNGCKKITNKSIKLIADKIGKRLSGLGISRTAVTPEAILYLKKCPNIAWLAAENIPLGDKEIEVVGTFSALRNLFIYKPTASEAVLLKNLAKLKNLRETALRCTNLSPQSREVLRKSAPRNKIFAEELDLESELSGKDKAPLEFIMEQQKLD